MKTTMFTKLMGRLALWLEDLSIRLRSKYDLCCYPECERQAEYYCITGGHRHCPDHESGFYNDVEFCQSCYESMTPEEKQKEIDECGAVNNPSSPIEGSFHAWEILKGKFKDDKGIIRPTTSGYHPTEREMEAIDYLCDERDYCYENLS